MLGLFAVVVLVPEMALAATEEEKITKEIVAKTNVLIRFGSAMLWPILLLIGALMDNDLIFGAGMEERILSIWTQIRDFTNLLFVFLLIAAALINVFKGLSGEEAEGGFKMQSFLSSFVIGLVIINFTYLGSKLVLDSANVVTSAVFALPNTALSTEKNNAIAIQNATEYCKRAREDSQKSSPARSSTGYIKFLCNEENKGTQLALESMLSQFNTRNAAFALAVNMGKLEIQELKSSGVNFLKDYTINLLFSLVMYIIYLVAFIAMFLLLLGRLVVLWVAVVMSPLLAAFYVFKDISVLSGLGGDKAGEWQKRLISAVTAPIILGVFLSIGYILLDAFRGVDNFYLDFSTGGTATQISGMNDLREIMIALITAGIVWMGVEVAKENSIFSGAIEKVTGLAKSVGEWVGRAPFRYIPLVPVPGVKGKGGNVALADLGTIFNRLKTNESARRASNLQKMFPGIFGAAASKNFSQQLQAATTKAAVAPHLQKFLQNRELYKDKKIYNLAIKKAQEVGLINKDLASKLKEETTRKTIAAGNGTTLPAYQQFLQSVRAEVKRNAPKPAASSQKPKTTPKQPKTPKTPKQGQPNNPSSS